jgi:hypothetical protein
MLHCNGDDDGESEDAFSAKLELKAWRIRVAFVYQQNAPLTPLSNLHGKQKF